MTEFNYFIYSCIICYCRYDQWQKYTKELEELNLSVENFTVSTLLKESLNESWNSLN